MMTVEARGKSSWLAWFKCCSMGGVRMMWIFCVISEKKKEGREQDVKARQRKRKTEKGGALLAAPLLDQSSYDVVMN
eukprot:scaffold15741_cov168-Skeletonema_marinoi.AAC.2